MRVQLCLLAACLSPAAVGAQSKPAPPDCSAAEHRAFDFWVGEWTVTDSAGTKSIGKNSIARTEQGCLLHERWSGGGGTSGQSFNYYDRQRGQWEQLWVSSNGNVLRLAGNRESSAMVLKGEQSAPGGGETLQEIRWTPQPDGRVRQTWRQSGDGGGTWQVVFDGWYRRDR